MVVNHKYMNLVTKAKMYTRFVSVMILVRNDISIVEFI